MNPQLTTLTFETEQEELKSKNLECVDCRNSFIFSTSEQEFYRNRGFSHEPKRCPNCRTSKRLRNSDQPVVATEITCMECNIKTTVPFKPRNENEVYCASCFKARGYQRPVLAQ